MKSVTDRLSVATRLFVLHLVFVLVLSVVALVVLWVDAHARVEQNAENLTRVVSSSIADDPFVIRSVQGDQPSTLLEPYALNLMHDAHVDFITIMSPSGIRFTHSDPAQIGKPYIGTIGPAQQGRSLTETYTGTLGPSVRSVYPIEDDAGQIIGLVSSGVTVGSVASAVNSRLGFVIGAALILLLLGAVASLLLRRYLDRVTHGMGEQELERMFSYYEAVLYSVREGLLLVDPAGRLTLYNEQAALLLNLPPASARSRTGVPVADLPIPESLRAVLGSGDRVHDLIQLTDDRVLVVNQEPAEAPPGSRRRLPARLGTVTTLRDHTELQQLTGELETMRTLADSLRSQTHEFSNKLHTIVSLIELGRAREALDFVTERLQVNQMLTDRLVGAIDEPVLAALALGKAAQAEERGVDLRVTVSSTRVQPRAEPAHLVTIVGNLLDNAIDSAAESEGRWVSLDIGTRVDADASASVVIVVADSGAGVSAEEADLIFARGYSTKETGHGRGYGLALVAQAIRQERGSITVANGDPGAVFTVTLPDRRGAEGEASAEPVVTHG
ncbi:sensor histidine kinase [Cryobacterium tepidiphilum]|uniref:histidine kinase n=1 Tax=Cryobacterium tepidiphilum TaxID=2486026 RepID=A0A3M8L0I0_9MICO|nr:ATP-binding protein [Cryobacterium tepidiphilum]RNE59047.1 GHKL domain-containing protein [Cryobacterium tepidiphilum]